MKQQTRRLLLGAVLLASLVAAFWGDPPPDEAAPRRPPARTRNAPGTAAAPGPLSPAASAPVAWPEAPAESAAAEGAAQQTAGIDPFRSKSWYVAPPPPPAPKPTAPPLPFRFVGRVVEDGETRVFLAQQNRYLIVRAGDVINATYGVEAIDERSVHFIYLPLKEAQTLAMGGAPE